MSPGNQKNTTRSHLVRAELHYVVAFTEDAICVSPTFRRRRQAKRWKEAQDTQNEPPVEHTIPLANIAQVRISGAAAEIVVGHKTFVLHGWLANQGLRNHLQLVALLHRLNFHEDRRERGATTYTRSSAPTIPAVTERESLPKVLRSTRHRGRIAGNGLLAFVAGLLMTLPIGTAAAAAMVAAAVTAGVYLPLKLELTDDELVIRNFTGTQRIKWARLRGFDVVGKTTGHLMRRHTTVIRVMRGSRRIPIILMAYASRSERTTALFMIRAAAETHGIEFDLELAELDLLPSNRTGQRYIRVGGGPGIGSTDPDVVARAVRSLQPPDGPAQTEQDHENATVDRH